MGTAVARRICVTGASGQAGRAVVRELLECGYEVAATDIAATRDDLEAVGRDDAGAFRAVVGDPVRRAAFSHHHGSGDYKEFPSVWPDPQARKWNLWGYVDVRDVAAACRLALEAPAEAVADSPAFIIA